MNIFTWKCLGWKVLETNSYLLISTCKWSLKHENDLCERWIEGQLNRIFTCCSKTGTKKHAIILHREIEIYHAYIHRRVTVNKTTVTETVNTVTGGELLLWYWPGSAPHEARPSGRSRNRGCPVDWSPRNQGCVSPPHTVKQPSLLKYLPCTIHTLWLIGWQDYMYVITVIFKWS